MKTNMLPEKMRVCETTGLPVCLDAQLFIRLNAVMAVIFLLIGGTAALFLALTRWSAVHLLSADWFYRTLTIHGLSMLIYWIIFMEVAILNFAATTPLNSKLFSRKVGWVSFILMTVGALMTEFIVFIGKGDVLMTSYVPLKAHPLFYLGIILFAVGTLIGVFNFFATLYIAYRDKTFEGSMPLVTFGALAAAIIAVVTLLHGAAAMIPAFLWSLDLGIVKNFDPGLYRLIWWGLGHPSQQINVAAMVSVWYLMATLTTGARPLNQAVCRSAFVLYILFINLASAHHLLVDPGVGAAWKMWNTSYALYLAVLASMIHGFTVPASIEVAMRAKGHDKGLFAWLRSAPWKDPGFSGVFISIVIFGFLGGITGVTLGTHQINIIAHNTLRIPGHFHATVAGGTSLAFMALAYYVVPLIFQKDIMFKRVARIQPYVFGLGIVLVSVAMSFAGSYGVPRRHWDVTFQNAPIPAGFGSAAHTFLALLGIGGIIAFIGLLMFVVNIALSVFFGKSIAGQKMPSWQTPEEEAATKEFREREFKPGEKFKVPGTVTLTFIFLISFAVYYFANWKALADVWYVK